MSGQTSLAERVRLLREALGAIVKMEADSAAAWRAQEALMLDAALASTRAPICANPGCGRAFEPMPTHPNQRYCSRRCREQVTSRHYRARRAAKAKPPPP